MIFIKIISHVECQTFNDLMENVWFNEPIAFGDWIRAKVMFYVSSERQGLNVKPETNEIVHLGPSNPVFEPAKFQSQVIAQPTELPGSPLYGKIS